MGLYALSQLQIIHWKCLFKIRAEVVDIEELFSVRVLGEKITAHLLQWNYFVAAVSRSRFVKFLYFIGKASLRRFQSLNLRAHSSVSQANSIARKYCLILFSKGLGVWEDLLPWNHRTLQVKSLIWLSLNLFEVFKSAGTWDQVPVVEHKHWMFWFFVGENIFSCYEFFWLGPSWITNFWHFLKLLLLEKSNRRRKLYIRLLMNVHVLKTVLVLLALLLTIYGWLLEKACVIANLYALPGKRRLTMV